MQHAWENVLELKLSVERVESNPQLVQIVPPNEVVVLISFELTLGDLRGMMNLCIPFNSIERIGGKLSANSWVSYGKKPRDAAEHRADQPAAVAFAGGAGRRLGRNADRHRRSDRPASRRHHHHRERRAQPLVVSVEGRPKFHAEPGVLKGRKAIQVAEMIGEPAGEALTVSTISRRRVACTFCPPALCARRLDARRLKPYNSGR